MHIVPLQPLYVVGGLVVTLAAAATLLGPPRSRVTIAIGAAVLALVTQWGMSLAEGRGVDAMRTRIIKSGHVEFTLIGSRPLDFNTALSSYEEFCRPPSRFIQSKPPGQLLGYMAISRLADRLLPGDLQSRHPLPRVFDEAQRRLIELLAWLLPLGMPLAVGLFVVLAFRLTDSASATAAGMALAVTAPAVLVIVHFDQAVYPWLAAACCLCSVRAGASERSALLWGGTTGAVVWLSLFVSFSLLGILPLAAVCGWMASSDASNRWQRRRSMSLGAGLGFLIPTLILSAGWGYDMLHRYRSAMAFHVAYKLWEPTFGNMLRMARVDLVEFFWWLGPVSAPALVAMVVGTVRVIRRRATQIDLFAAVLGITIVVLSLSRSAGEVARLWLFLVPAVLLVAARALRPGDRSGRWWSAGLAVAQVLWTITLKAYQDFY